jgi:hypothetical protein
MHAKRFKTFETFPHGPFAFSRALLFGHHCRHIVNGRKEPIELLEYIMDAITIGIQVEARRQVRSMKCEWKLQVWWGGITISRKESDGA